MSNSELETFETPQENKYTEGLTFIPGEYRLSRVGRVPYLTAVMSLQDLGRVDILLLLSWETLKLLEKRPETEFFLQNSVSFLGGYLGEPIYVSLLSGYDEMSTEPSLLRHKHQTFFYLNLHLSNV